MPTAPVCCGSKLPASTNTRWYVFEDDCGGQILATIPVSLVPTWRGARHLRRALRVMCGDSDMSSVYVLEDFGGFPSSEGIHDDLDAYHAYMEMTCPWVLRNVVDEGKLPLGVALAFVHEDPFPDSPVSEATRLAEWEFAGGVSGGMGGGRLLKNDMWFHSGLLGRGQEFVNRVRQLLGQTPLDHFELLMSEGDRQHNELMSAFGIL